jgi:large subunit ribosomal protein L4
MSTITSVIFGGEVNEQLLSQAVRVYRANQRQDTVKTKARGEVNRTKKKWFRQKGTGNARHGARTPSLFVGGGVAHGPNGQQDHSLKLSTKMKKQAMLSALALQKDNASVENKLMSLGGKTKEAATLLGKRLDDSKRTLIVVDDMKPDVVRSLNNLETVLLVHADRLNILEVLNADSILFTKEAVAILEKRLQKEGK